MTSNGPKVPERRRRAPAKSAGARDVDAFLAKAASIPGRLAPGERGRLLFAMDATMSRQPTWDRALSIQAEMFHETASIGGLDVQLVWFRGFGEFKASAWVSDAERLAGEMTAVRCRGGRTQIERVLAHALEETARKRVNAVVYVGDCMEEEIDRLCDQAGQLGLKGVPAFIFQEGRDPNAERAFREIARLTGGAYCRLDRNAAAMLRDLLSAVAVFAAGGRRALKDYSRSKGEAVKLLAQQVK